MVCGRRRPHAARPTVFEDVVKTICTTNTAWSGTRKMTAALVDHLGSEAPGGRRTFPTPAAMAAADQHFYNDVFAPATAVRT